MIKSISIENFRCFHQTKVEGFGQVNLIGGQNNAGKTTLLEAIYLANNPHSSSVIFLQQKLRSEAADANHPERTWSSLFHKFEKDQKIKLSAEAASATLGGWLLCKESYEKQPDSVKNDDLVKIEDDSNLSGKVSQSILLFYHLKQPTQKPSMWIEANLGGRKFVMGGGFNPPPFYPHFVPAGFKSNPATLAENFERLRFQGRDKVVLEGLQLIEPSIQQVEVFNFGEKRIHLKRAGEEFMPITLFGDGLNKVADIILRIASNANSILLIDEIENGVHYAHHRDLWKFVFKLATQFGVQIFAASHSYEMIRAFNQMASAENLGPSAMYFEMYRSLRSGEIIGKGFAPDLLAYAIANNQSFRGE
jgi:ABC-type branched-subunit amino acid transport system ATPase component